MHYEDVEIGDAVGPLERVVSDDQVRRFVSVCGAGAGPSRFTDPEVARSEGLPFAIVPGAMNIAIISQVLTSWSPGVSLKKLDIVFRQMVPHNATTIISKRECNFLRSTRGSDTF